MRELDELEERAVEPTERGGGDDEGERDEREDRDEAATAIAQSADSKSSFA